MFGKILYPTDFSDVSQKTLEYIKQFKDCGAEDVIVLHIFDDRAAGALYPWSNSNVLNHLKNNNKLEVTNRLEDIKQELAEAGLGVTVQATDGIPAREILKMEKEEDVSILIMGSHGVSNLEEMFLGSVSEKVIRKCTKPVMVVKR